MNHTSVMQTRRAAKSERLEARVTPRQKEYMLQAADLLGLSLTEFLVSSAQREARATIRRHRVITLSARDSLAFAEAILNPGKPNAALQAAFERYGPEGTA